MPSTYAHKKFGALVYKRLSGEIKEAVADNRECYLAGLHGPDVLFFHKFGINSLVAKAGHLAHRASFDEMYNTAVKVLSYNADDDKLAYFAGYICHYMLDSACHPLVDKAIEETGMTHGKIEMEYDRYLLLKDGKRPIKYPMWAHIPVSYETAIAASNFYEGISAEDFFLSLTAMKTILMTCNSNSDFVRQTICGVMEKTGNEGKIASLIMSRQKSQLITDYVHEMYEKMLSEVDETVKEIETLANSVEENSLNSLKLPERFKLNFLGIEV